MNKKIIADQNGNVVSLTVGILLIISLTVFGIWAYAGYLDQKNNTDDKIAAAVTEAENLKAQELEAEFADRQKSPHATYTSPSASGSVKITYPRTWSAYVDERDTGSTPVDAYFHPNFVPAKSVTYALRAEITGADYDREVGSYDSQVERGDLKSKPIKKSGVTGVYLEGQLSSRLNGAMVLFAIRDKTLSVWTENTDYIKDFNNIVVENLSFEP